MKFGIDDPEVKAEARTMLRETIEASGWYPDLRPQDRAKRIEQDVDQMWRMWPISLGKGAGCRRGR